MHHTIKAHQSCELLCPWCIKAEHLFRYPADLSRHTQHQHLEVYHSLPPRTLTAANCFYFSKVPAQYMELFVAVSVFTSLEAQFAMKSVAQWCTGRTPGASHWMTGWQLAKSTSTNPQISSSSVIASSSQKTTDHSKTPSSTTLPLSFPLILKSIDISNGAVKIFVSSETHLYQVRLLQQARSRPEVIGRIVTLSATTVEMFIAPPAAKFELCPDDEARKHISKLLAIDANDLTTVRQMPYTLKRSLPIHTTHIAKKICASPLPPSHPPTHPSKTPSITPIPQPVSPVSDRSQSSTSSLHDLKTPSPCSLGSPSPIDLENTTPSTNVHAASSTHTTTTDSSTTAAATIPQVSPLFYRPPPDCSTPLLYVPSSCATPSYHPTTMTSFRPVQARVRFAPPTVPSSPSAPIYIPTPKNNDLQQMARSLLSTGNMPVLPPAPREWSLVPDESIHLTPCLSWPPKNWTSFSPEEKGVLTEYAAGALEMASGIHPIQRQVLLYKYSYLSLTGAMIPPNKDTQMIFFNFKTVRDIALGISTFPKEFQKQFLECLQPLSPVDMVKFAAVPLRLTSE